MNEGGTSLRRIGPDDFGAIEAQYFPYSGRHLNVRRLQDAIADYPSVVARLDGQLMGFAYCFRFAPDVVELANIFIDKPFRGTGLASAMLQFIKDDLRGVQTAIIAVNSDLYETTEPKLRPDNFYLRNRFIILRTTSSSTIYWWQKESDDS